MNVHYHECEAPTWACGLRYEQATGVLSQVTCEECMASDAFIAKQAELAEADRLEELRINGNQKAISVPSPVVLDDRFGAVLGDVPEMPEV